MISSLARWVPCIREHQASPNPDADERQIDRGCMPVRIPEGTADRVIIGAYHGGFMRRGLTHLPKDMGHVRGGVLPSGQRG